MLAASCHRAGRSHDEGRALYSQGVMWDNAKQFRRAIQCYLKLLSACQSVNDLSGEALALNHIGVDMHLIGDFSKAMEYHACHEDKADIPGKFVAHLNLGLAHSALGEYELAVSHHQHALRYAVSMSSVENESLACGNLALASKHSGDVVTARANMDRHLQLAGDLQDPRETIDAYQELGQLASQQGDFEEAGRCYQHAIEISRQCGEEDDANLAKCALGVATGNLKFDEYISDVLGRQTIRADTFLTCCEDEQT